MVVVVVVVMMINGDDDGGGGGGPRTWLPHPPRAGSDVPAGLLAGGGSMGGRASESLEPAQWHQEPQVGFRVF